MIQNYTHKFKTIVRTLLWDDATSSYMVSKLTGLPMQDVNPIMMRLENMDCLMLTKNNMVQNIKVQNLKSLL